MFFCSSMHNHHIFFFKELNVVECLIVQPPIDKLDSTIDGVQLQ